MSQVINVLGRLRPTFGSYYCKYLSNLTKDVVKQSNNQDHLLDTLKNTSSTSMVLDLVSKHHAIMNSNHTMQAFRALFTLQKSNQEPDMSTTKLIKHPHFEKLCNRLRRQVGSMDVSDTIYALKALCFLGVRHDATIVQTLLQMLRHNINDLELSQIMFITFLLKQFNGTTPLMDALNIALPMVFQIQLPTKMDKGNMAHIAEYLYFAAKYRLSNKCVETIVASAIRCNNDMDSKTAISIIWSICDLPHDHYLQPLLDRCIEILNLNIDDLHYNDMETTLTKLLNKYSVDYPFYYNQVFFDLCCNYVIDKKLGVEVALYISRKLLKMAYVNNYLIDYISKEICKNPDIILKDPIFAYITAMYFSLTDYRTKDWLTIKNLLEETNVFDNINSDKKELRWLKLACSLIAMDIYKPNVIRKAFNEENPHKRRALDREHFLLITSAISVLKPEHSNLLPPESIIRKVEVQVPLDYPLEGPLQRGLGAENYLRTGVISNLGLHIDHVVALRPGGYPVALQSNSEELLEDINIPNDSQMILIFLLRHYHCSLNSKRMKSYVSLLLKIFEVKGYQVVPINHEDWMALEDFEKIPYLMQGINSKIESKQTLNSVA